MSLKDIALKYMEIFFSGRDFDRFYDILAEDLNFSGPFFQFNSAREYIERLKRDPPVHCSYRILKAFEAGESVNLIYSFSKPNVSTPMSQLFEFRGLKIKKILLIFDSKHLT